MTFENATTYRRKPQAVHAVRLTDQGHIPITHADEPWIKALIERKTIKYDGSGFVVRPNQVTTQLAYPGDWIVSWDGSDAVEVMGDVRFRALFDAYDASADMLPDDDPFDPNTLDFDWPSYVHSTNSDHRALVDYEDWLWLCNWQWRFKPSRQQGMLGRGYLCRTAWVYPPNAPRFTTSLYLHVEIMRRVEPPPTIFHTQVDHIDRDRMNCRRDNLRWATPSENNKNKALPPRVNGMWVKARKDTE